MKGISKPLYWVLLTGNGSFSISSPNIPFEENFIELKVCPEVAPTNADIEILKLLV